MQGSAADHTGHQGTEEAEAHKRTADSSEKQCSRLLLHNRVYYNAIQDTVAQCRTPQRPPKQCSTVQYSLMQCSTVQYSTVQYSTVQYNAVQYNTISTVQFSTIQYNTVQCTARMTFLATGGSSVFRAITRETETEIAAGTALARC